MNKTIVFLIITLFLLLGSGFLGFQYWNLNETRKTLENNISTLEQEKLVLIQAKTGLEEKNSQIELELSQIEERQKKTYLVYTMMKDGYFYPDLSTKSLTSLAILLDDREICNDINVLSNQKFCTDIFDDKCNEYSYPNRELCSNHRVMLNREVTPPEIINHCNSQELIEDDLAQTHCFQHFARITDNINLCDEICVEPINNTNCRAHCRDKNNELFPCKEQYVKECREYVLE